MFTDPRARGAWRHFSRQVESMLGSASPDARRELLDDLAAHVRDMVAHDPDGVSEYERLQAALDRMGDPREFLAPLLDDAILRDRREDVGAGQVRRATLSRVSRLWRFAWHSASTLLAVFLGATAILVAFGSLLSPDGVGLFGLGPDDIQLRLLGGQGGVPLFAPWFAIALVALAAASMAFAWRQARRLVIEMPMCGVYGETRD